MSNTAITESVDDEVIQDLYIRHFIRLAYLPHGAESFLRS